jgi:hypothetical protein
MVPNLDHVHSMVENARHEASSASGVLVRGPQFSPKMSAMTSEE